MGDTTGFMAFWRSLDELTGTVRTAWWGAVVTDARFPAIWDANYARVETRAQPPTVEEIEAELLPALVNAGARHEHVVVFFPEDVPDALTGFTSRGDRLTFDAVMVHDGRPTAAGDGRVSELDPDDRFWSAFSTSLGEFGVTEPEAVDQLLALERELIRVGGKRWFGVRAGNELVAIGSLLALGGVGYVDGIVTFPHARRRGHAAAITTHLVAEATSTGAGDVFLLAEVGGRAVPLYERLGFRHAGRLASTLRRLA